VNSTHRFASDVCCLAMQPAITSGIPLGSANSQYAAPQAYVNLAAAIVSTEGNCNPFCAALQALMLRTMVLSCLLDMIQACLDIARCEYQ